MHSEFSRGTGAGRDYSALVALAADDNRPALQRGIIEFFDRHEEGVHVDVEDGADEGGLGSSSHAGRILAAALSIVRVEQSGVLKLRTAAKIRLMPGRAVRFTARVAFLLCGLISLFTGVPYVALRGTGLPVQSEWVIFAVALALVGVFSVTVAVLPRSWIAKACKKDRDDEQLVSAPLKLLGGFAAISYVVALVAYLAPHRWNLDAQLMFSLCPMFFVKMTFDPSLGATFFLLAPMNAAVYGSLGLTLGYAWLALRKPTSSQTP